MLKVTIVNAVYPTEPDWSHANRWLTVILIDPEKFVADTHAIREALERENIEARPVWKPMHLQPVFGECLVRSAGCGVETGGEAEVRVQRSEVGERGAFCEGIVSALRHRHDRCGYPASGGSGKTVGQALEIISLGLQ